MPAYDIAAYRQMSEKEEALYAGLMREFAQMQSWRATFAAHWEEVAELVDPPSRNTFYYGNFNWPGQKKTDRQVDASAMMALERFSAICDSLLTPRNMKWHALAADDPYVMKQRGVQLWFEQATNILFKYRYDARANFSAQNNGQYRSLGAYGTGGVFIDAYDGTLDGQRGIRYKAIPLGELFIRENHQGIVNGAIRWFRYTAQQAYEKWGQTGRFPENLRTPLEVNSPMLFNFLHVICPRTDYDPGSLHYKNMPYGSYYLSLEGHCILTEGGYRTMPIAISRYTQTPGEIYGRSPAMMVLPAIKTLNAEKRTFLKQGHRAADPVLLTADDGVIDMKMHPGALNKGGVSADGKELVRILPTGNIQITETMMGEEKSLINDAFLVTLFQVLTETPTMTATEVIERTNEKGILLAPTVGRQQSEYLGPMIDRELSVLAQQGLLPPMPGVLREAKGAYQTIYLSPLSRAMRAQEAAGFIRTVETAKEIVNVTQDMSVMDVFDFDTAMPAIADIQGTPPSWMSSPDMISNKRRARAQAQQRQEQIQAAPAQAAIMKAQAAQAKAGAPGPGPAQSPAGGGPPLAQQVGG